MNKRARLERLTRWYHTTLNQGVTDPVDLDLIIDQVLSAWSSDLADYEALCAAVQLLDPQARAQMVSAISLHAKETTL